MMVPPPKKLGRVTLTSTNIPEEISSALTEGPGSILAIVVTKQKQKSQILGSDFLIVLEHLHIIMIFLLPLDEGIHGNKWMNLTNTKDLLIYLRKYLQLYLRDLVPL